MYMQSQKLAIQDTFLVSYPRSGNTWMRYLLANIMRPSGTWHISNLNEVVPDIYQVDLDKYASANIYKSHEPFTESYGKVIYIFRDGRDVAVSYYNLMKTAFGCTCTFDEFIISMLTGGKETVYGSWQNHVLGWMRSGRNNDIFFIKYEDLCEDTPKVLKNVCDFMGIDPSPESIPNAIRRSTFEVQQEDVRKYSEHYSKGFRGGVKGSPGKWREIFSASQNELFWSYSGDLMTRLGYTK